MNMVFDKMAKDLFQVDTETNALAKVAVATAAGTIYTFYTYIHTYIHIYIYNGIIPSIHSSCGR